jgi:hypothetical protein
MENSTESTDALVGKLISAIAKLISEFELTCIMHFVIGKGETMTLSDDTFQGIANEVMKLQKAAGGPLVGASPVTIKGKQYYTKCINFYGSEAYDYALGCSTVYFDAEGTPVGIRDRYDFDAAKHRDSDSENLVKIVNMLMQLLKVGKEYDIVYGVGAE